MPISSRDEGHLFRADVVRMVGFHGRKADADRRGWNQPAEDAFRGRCRVTLQTISLPRMLMISRHCSILQTCVRLGFCLVDAAHQP